LILQGKGGGGYLLKSWIINRGKGSPKVNIHFRDAIRLVGTPNEYRLNNRVALRMKYGGPRYAGMKIS